MCAPLSPPGGRPTGPFSVDEVPKLISANWCTGCPVTRRGMMVPEHNRSSLRDTEQFCRQESRGLLGMRSTMTCCTSGSAGCHICKPTERRTVRNDTLPWHVKRWLPVWAGLSYPADYPPPDQPWECTHPMCTGKDRNRYP